VRLENKNGPAAGCGQDKLIAPGQINGEPITLKIDQKKSYSRDQYSLWNFIAETDKGFFENIKRVEPKY
jgi:hypothetical protein